MQNTKNIRNWILEKGKNAETFHNNQYTELLKQKSNKMSETDVWAFVGETQSAKFGIKAYFVNIYGELLCYNVKTNKQKIFSYSDKLVLAKDYKRNQYGRYIYTTVGAMHRLVAYAFLDNPDNLPEVDHIDGNPANNNVENLRWVSHRENMNNPISKKRTKNTCAKRWTYAYIQHSKVGIVQYSLDFSEKLAVFKTEIEAAAKLGVSKSCIHNALQQNAKCLNFKRTDISNFWLRKEIVYWYEKEKVKLS